MFLGDRRLSKMLVYYRFKSMDHKVAVLDAERYQKGCWSMFKDRDIFSAPFL